MNLKKQAQILILSILLPLFLSSSGLSKEMISRETPYKNKRILGVQIPLIESKNLIEFEKKLSLLKRLGFNTVIIRVFHNQGDRVHRLVKSKNRAGVYFESSLAPSMGDLLKDMVEISHKNSMKIYAWMSTRSCDWFTSENKLRDSYYDFQSKKIRRTRRLNLFNKKALNYLKRLYADLARYDIDGILFQDDLIMKHNESFSKEAKAAFFKQSGRALVPKNLYRNIRKNKNGIITGYGYTGEFWKWTDWKINYLTQVLQELILSAKRVNPDLKFMVNLYYETISDPKNARAWLSQDLDRLRELDIDYFSLMFYHRQIRKELNLSHHEVKDFLKTLSTKAVKRTGSPKRAVFKVQVVDWYKNEMIPTGEIDEIINSLASKERVNLLFFPKIPLEEAEQYQKILY